MEQDWREIEAYYATVSPEKRDIVAEAIHYLEGNERNHEKLGQLASFCTSNQSEDGETLPVEHLWLDYAREVMKACQAEHLRRKQVRISRKENDGGCKREEKWPLKGQSVIHRFNVEVKYERVKEVFKFGLSQWKIIEGREAGDVERRLRHTRIYHEMLDVLIYYERGTNRTDSLVRMAKMEKRKLDSLNKILTILKSRDPMETRKMRLEIKYEVGELVMSILEIKMKQFERTLGSVQPELLQKMAYYCAQGVETHQDIIKDIQPDLDIAAIGAEDEKVMYVSSHYQIGRFFNKYFSPDRDEQIGYTERAIEHYKAVICHCARFPDLKKPLKEELENCRQSVDMLERQIGKMTEKNPYEEEVKE